MSHYFAAVVVPPDDARGLYYEEIHDAVGRLMAPYDENLRVPRYREPYPDAEKDLLDARKRMDDEDCKEPFTGDRSSDADVFHWYGGVKAFHDEDGWYRWSTANPKGEWDWWQIGGRWTGVWSGYDPRENPGNIEVCWLCQGTGLRDDEAGRRARREDPAYRCNGCPGDGRMLKWPTRWGFHEGDVTSVSRFLGEMRMDGEQGEGISIPHTLVTQGRWAEREKWVYPDSSGHGHFDKDDNWLGTIREELELYLHGGLVVVDYHS